MSLRKPFLAWEISLLQPNIKFCTCICIHFCVKICRRGIFYLLCFVPTFYYVLINYAKDFTHNHNIVVCGCLYQPCFSAVLVIKQLKSFFSTLDNHGPQVLPGGKNGKDTTISICCDTFSPRFHLHYQSSIYQTIGPCFEMKARHHCTPKIIVPSYAK